MVIFPGWIGPLGFLHFSPPVRSIDGAASQRFLDEKYSTLVCMWETANLSLEAGGLATHAHRRKDVCRKYFRCHFLIARLQVN